MDKFLGKHNCLQLDEEELEDMSFLIIGEIESEKQPFLVKELQAQTVSLWVVPDVQG